MRAAAEADREQTSEAIMPSKPKPRARKAKAKAGPKKHARKPTSKGR